MCWHRPQSMLQQGAGFRPTAHGAVQKKVAVSGGGGGGGGGVPLKPTLRPSASFSTTNNPGGARFGRRVRALARRRFWRTGPEKAKTEAPSSGVNYVGINRPP